MVFTPKGEVYHGFHSLNGLNKVPPPEGYTEYEYRATDGMQFGGYKSVARLGSLQGSGWLALNLSLKP